MSKKITPVSQDVQGRTPGLPVFSGKPKSAKSVLWNNGKTSGKKQNY